MTTLEKRDSIINSITWEKVKKSLQSKIDNLTLVINIGPRYMRWNVSKSSNVLHTSSMIPISDENIKWAKYHGIVHARRVIARS